MRLRDAGNEQPVKVAGGETYRWLRELAEWRVRFTYDNGRPGMTHSEVSEFVQDSVAPLCDWTAEGVDVVLYIRKVEDLQTIIRCYGSVTDGCGHIAATQSRAAYVNAIRLAVEREPATLSPEAQAEQDAEVMPDIVWSVVGQGQARIATTMVRGHRIVVRHGFVGMDEMWLVDVDSHPACAKWRARGDAMSKLSVGMAIRMSATSKRPAYPNR